MTTAYITKYALTRGVIKAEGTVGAYGGTFTVDGRCYHSAEWRPTLEQAIANAKERKLLAVAKAERELIRAKGIEIFVAA